MPHQQRQLLAPISDGQQQQQHQSLTNNHILVLPTEMTPPQTPIFVENAPANTTSIASSTTVTADDNTEKLPVLRHATGTPISLLQQTSMQNNDATTNLVINHVDDSKKEGLVVEYDATASFPVTMSMHTDRNSNMVETASFPVTSTTKPILTASSTTSPSMQSTNIAESDVESEERDDDGNNTEKEEGAGDDTNEKPNPMTAIEVIKRTAQWT